LSTHSISGPFQVNDATTTCQGTIAASGNCQAMIQFAPTARGLQSGTLSLSGNFAGTVKVHLEGIGKPGPSVTPTVTPTPTPTPVPGASPTPTPPGSSPTATPTPGGTSSPTATPTPGPGGSPTATSTPSGSGTQYLPVLQ
jgi:hypothetical protein